MAPAHAHFDEKATFPSISDNSVPLVIRSLQCSGIPDYEQRAFGSSERDVHTPDISQETDPSVICRPDRGEDDDVFLLTLETVNSTETVWTSNFVLSECDAQVDLANSLDIVERCLSKVLPEAPLQFVELLTIRADDPYPP